MTKLASVMVTGVAPSVVAVPDEFVNVTGHGSELVPTETVGVKFRPGQLKASELDTAMPLTGKVLV
jgi:hypothetical protein